jgi:hypothetical protein
MLQAWLLPERIYAVSRVGAADTLQSILPALPATTAALGGASSGLGIVAIAHSLPPTFDWAKAILEYSAPLITIAVTFAWVHVLARYRRGEIMRRLEDAVAIRDRVFANRATSKQAGRVRQAATICCLSPNTPGRSRIVYCKDESVLTAGLNETPIPPALLLTKSVCLRTARNQQFRFIALIGLVRICAGDGQ